MEISTVKVKKPLGRLSDVTKKLRLQSNVPGSDCKCKRLNCFTQVNETARNKILRQFNELPTYNDQNFYLASLISLTPIKRRRPGKDKDVVNFKDSSYQFKVRVLQNDKIVDVQVCYKAFLSIHGITGRRVQTIQGALKNSGSAPIDGRGKHSNRKHKLTEETVSLVMKHISSFKPQSSPLDFSLDKTKKSYLPKDLSVFKMYNMFKENYKDCKISYDSYRTIFNKKFNITFGYPPSEPCSFQEKINIKLQNMHSQILQTIGREYILQELQKLEAQQKHQLRNEDMLYEKIAKIQKDSKKRMDNESICIDDAKNLSVPNISINDNA